MDENADTRDVFRNLLNSGMLQNRYLIGIKSMLKYGF